MQIIGRSNNKYWTQLHITVWLLSQTFVIQEAVFLNKCFKFDDPVTPPIVISECDWFPSGKRKKLCGKWQGPWAPWQAELLFYSWDGGELFHLSCISNRILSVSQIYFFYTSLLLNHNVKKRMHFYFIQGFIDLFILVTRIWSPVE